MPVPAAAESDCGPPGPPGPNGHIPWGSPCPECLQVLSSRVSVGSCHLNTREGPCDTLQPAWGSARSGEQSRARPSASSTLAWACV